MLILNTIFCAAFPFPSRRSLLGSPLLWFLLLQLLGTAVGISLKNPMRKLLPGHPRGGSAPSFDLFHLMPARHHHFSQIPANPGVRQGRMRVPLSPPSAGWGTASRSLQPPGTEGKTSPQPSKKRPAPGTARLFHVASICGFVALRLLP